MEVFKPLLGGERLRELALSLPEVRLGRGESFRTADYAGAFFVVLEGRVRVYAVLRERELTLLVAGPAEIFGPAGSGGAMPQEWVRAMEIKIRTRYTHRELGTMIGANREAVTNALLQLRRAGVVKMAGRHIHVVDIRGLERLAGGDS